MRAVGYELVAATAEPFTRASRRCVDAYQLVLKHMLGVRSMGRTMRLAIAVDGANI